LVECSQTQQLDGTLTISKKEAWIGRSKCLSSVQDCEAIGKTRRGNTCTYRLKGNSTEGEGNVGKDIQGKERHER